MLITRHLTNITHAASQMINDVCVYDRRFQECVIEADNKPHVYIHGRGLSGLWSIGALYALSRQKDQQFIYHGYSSGAIVAVLHVCGFSMDELLRLYYQIHETYITEPSHSVTLTDYMVNMLTTILPPNAYILCSNRVYIGYTSVLPWLRYIEVSQFKSNQDIITLLVKSIRIPGVTNGITSIVSNDMDGGLGCFVHGWPITPSTMSTSIELFPPFRSYMSYNFVPTDPYAGLRILQGVVDMVYFMSGRPTSYVRYIPRPKKSIRNIITDLVYQRISTVTNILYQ